MSDRRPSTSPLAHPNQGLFPIRLIAILIMVAGAAGFVATLLVWGERILFLSISTIITFIGLGLLILGRRLETNQPGNGDAASSPFEGSTERQAEGDIRNMEASGNGAIYPGDEDINGSMAQRAISSDAMSLPTLPPEPMGIERDNPMGEPPAIKPGLLAEVMDSLKLSGAQVTVENQRADRAILQFSGSDGLVYVAMVHDNLWPVEISELRSLFALMKNQSSAGGFMFSSVPFSTQAYEWAGSRKIRLVMADELDEISF